MKVKATIIQTAAPDYRKPLFDFLSRQKTFDFKLFTGLNYFEPTVKTVSYGNYCTTVKNVFLFNRKALFQFGMWLSVVNSQIVVIELNPRIISNWLILLLRKMLNKKTILWGHAWPRSGPNSKSDKLRNTMRFLADEIIVYTKQQSIELQKKMPQKNIIYAPNALYFKKEMGVSKNFDRDRCNNIIYVGRLTVSKKIFLLVKAFHKSFENLPQNSNLLIVGEGSEKRKIKDYIESYNLQNRVTLFGHVSDRDLLKKYYETSLISVSPGYVGLSITQSLGFGVPMLISKNENHSPELEATTSINSMFFETDDLNDLSKKIKQVFGEKEKWISKREQISKECAQNYSIELMSQTFMEAFKN